MSEQLKLNSLCIHAGGHHGDVKSPLKDPIYMSNSYYLPTDGTPVDWSGIHTQIYARNGNQNQFTLQDKLCAIEKAEACVVLGSGVAALSGAFLAVLKTGDHVICSQVCYAAVGHLMEELLPDKFQIETTFVDTTDLSAVQAAIRPNTKLIHVETPGNPTTGISDIAAIADMAHKAGAMLSVDSTFASPVLQHPLELGADLLIHSMTKYINGHGDSLGGAILGKLELIDQIKEQIMVNFGGVLSPFNAWLINRGLATLPLRMRQHCENGMAVARFLEASPDVRFVYYPGLESHPQHELASRQMHGGYSGMICFDIKGDHAAHLRFLAALKMLCHAVSLGDGESLIVFTDADSPKMKYYPAAFQQGYYRFSIGLEDAEDIIADLDCALKASR